MDDAAPPRMQVTSDRGPLWALMPVTGLQLRATMVGTRAAAGPIAPGTAPAAICRGKERRHAEALPGRTGPGTARTGSRRLSGSAAQTVVGGHEKVLRQTVMAMVKDTDLAEHANPGEASVYVLGGVLPTAADQSWEGEEGDLLIVPDAPHRLQALQDSAVLLTVAKRP